MKLLLGNKILVLILIPFFFNLLMSVNEVDLLSSLFYF